jgi:localization factor PodJL
MKRLSLALLTTVIATVVAGLLLRWNSTPDPAPAARVPDSQEVARTEARARAGDAPAQRQMGRWRLGENGAPRDYTQAADWLTQAAAAGDAEAQCLLGDLFQTGRGVARDLDAARSWFEKAAAQRHAGALYQLGSLYAAGRGVEQSSERAAGLYEQAALLGDSLAQFNVAQRYELGRGVAANLVESWKWYSLAAAGGVADAAGRRASVEARLSRSELVTARQQVAEFKPGAR